ncbi:uncharacterized protein LOC132804986 [Ziziphus jujuba]|uniref:Uncharacterized protein LOC132804986 n=1 Tax=Ziziphus jujuba TaxID=326968 RepID=A0ABM4AFN5_ZIZJJ|nr:uncharacterized protein LOC132804986 [Ziziphus jujuba]
MDEEIATIEKNDTWVLVDLPEGTDVIGLKWIYKPKYKENGAILKYKARLVAKGYSQQPGIMELFLSSHGIAQAYGLELHHGLRAIACGNNKDQSIINTLRNSAREEEVFEKVANIAANEVPIFLKKHSRKAIDAWSLPSTNIKKNTLDFLVFNIVIKSS